MTRSMITAYPDESLLLAQNKMTTNGVGKLLVVSPKNGELVAILARTDPFKLYNKNIQESLEMVEKYA